MKDFFKRRSAKAEATIQAYRRLFSTDDGKVVLIDLMRSTKLFDSVIGRDTHDTYLNEGGRQVLLRILNTVGMTEKQIVALREQMLEEEQDLFEQ